MFYWEGSSSLFTETDVHRPFFKMFLAKSCTYVYNFPCTFLLLLAINTKEINVQNHRVVPFIISIN